MSGLSLISCLCILHAPPSVTVPFHPHLWRPDGGDARWTLPAEFETLETNGFYIRAPRSADMWSQWRRDLEALRTAWAASRGPATVRLDYRGVRAWVRLSPEAARALDLKPAEHVRVRLDARWLSGNPELCLAFDFIDRKTGTWNGWSTVRATATVPRDAQWHTVTLECPVPPFESQRDVAVVIVGQDATRDPSPSTLLLRALETSVPATPRRQQAARAIVMSTPPAPPTAIYDRRDMQWATKNFACLFLFLYDTEVYDREQRRYRTRELLERW